MTKNSLLIIQEAEALGLSVEVISDKKHLFSLEGNGHSLLVCELFSMTLDPNSEAYRLSKHKDMTYTLWERAGIPFPQYYHFKNLEEFREKISALPLTFPLITKESKGSKSVNVHMDIRSIDELAEVVQSYQKGFMVQQMALGNEYRLLMYKGRLLGALRMVPPSIMGDGTNTINELIMQKNLSLPKKLKITEGVLSTLSKAGLSLESIPEKGATIMLQKNSRLSEGGATEDCTERVHKEIAELAWRAIAATNLNLSGIDLVCSDIATPIAGQALAFLEVNTYPDLSIHYNPTIGKPRTVIKPILEDVFEIPSR